MYWIYTFILCRGTTRSRSKTESVARTYRHFSNKAGTNSNTCWPTIFLGCACTYITPSRIRMYVFIRIRPPLHVFLRGGGDGVVFVFGAKQSKAAAGSGWTDGQTAAIPISSGRRQAAEGRTDEQSAAAADTNVAPCSDYLRPSTHACAYLTVNYSTYM